MRWALHPDAAQLTVFTHRVARLFHDLESPFRFVKAYENHPIHLDYPDAGGRSAG
jgi:hypothetical protein